MILLNSFKYIKNTNNTNKNIDQKTYNKNIFIQKLLLSTLTKQLHILKKTSIYIKKKTPRLSPPNNKTPENISPSNSNTHNKIPPTKPSTSKKNNSITLTKTQQPTNEKKKNNITANESKITSSNSRKKPSQNASPIVRQNHNSHEKIQQIYNSHSKNNSISTLTKTNINNPVPLPKRPLSKNKKKNNKINPTTIKKTIFKPIPTSQISNRKPPPH